MESGRPTRPLRGRGTAPCGCGRWSRATACACSKATPPESGAWRGVRTANAPSPGADDSTVRLWEVESGRCLRVLEGHTDSVLSVAWSPDGQRALSGAWDRTVRLWEVESGRCLRVLEGHTDSVRSVAWSPDGQRALSGADDSTVRLWGGGVGPLPARARRPH